MKKIFFLSLMAIVCQMMQAFEVNGISYTIIDGEAVVVRPGTEDYITNITYKYDGKLEMDLFRINTSSYVGDITIPSSISFEGKEYPVTGIAQCAFMYQGITSLSLPNTIINIGFGAFHKSKLKELILPNSIKRIGDKACYEMLELERLVLPSELDSIPDNFCRCEVLSTGIKSKLKDIVFPESPKYLGKYAFYCQTEIEPISLPNSIEYVGPGAFYQDNFPTSVPTNLKELEASAFSMCKGLKNIKVAGKFKIVPEECFRGTSNCLTLELEEGIEEIDRGAFSGMTKVRTLILPSTLKSLKRNSLYMFSGLNYLSGLTSVYALMKEPCNLVNCEWGDIGFSGDPAYKAYENTTLYVPIGCTEAYKAAGWGEYFSEIIEMDEVSQRAAFAKSVTGITTVIAPSKTNAGYFNLQGQKLDAPQKGINILRTEDGKAKKVYVK